jgi:hypothetical protein
MLYSVVVFDRENSVELVPSSWLSNENRQCLYPKVSTLKLTVFIKSLEKPDITWPIYNCRCLKQCGNKNKLFYSNVLANYFLLSFNLGTYELGLKAALKAEQTSNLESDDEEESTIIKSRRRRKRSHSSSEEENTAAKRVSTQGRRKVLKIPAQKPKSTIIQPSTQLNSGKLELRF